jgi:RNA polymerase sigma-70 factor (ECF subfamily)
MDLLLKAQSGDADALEGLVARYLPRLQRWASGRLPAGLRTTLDTGDVVQEAVINALRDLDTLDIRSEGALQASLRHAVNNRIVDLHRRAAQRPEHQDLPDDPPADSPSPLEAAIGAAAVESYENALAALRDEDRQAIVLRVEFGLSYDEIAGQLGKASGDAARLAVTEALGRLVDETRRKV